MSCNEKLEVELRNYDETLYAKALIADDFTESVQKPVDSSRGYALRLTSDDGRTMWVGLKFHDRNEAFDFNEVFIIHQNNKQKEQQAHFSSQEKADLTQFQLRPGQKISIGGVKNDNEFDGAGLFDNPFGSSSQSNNFSRGNAGSTGFG